MEIVGAGFHYKPLHAATGVAELRWVTAGQHRHFLNRVWRKRKRSRIALHFRNLRAHAVDLHLFRKRLAPIDMSVKGIAGRTRGKEEESFRGASTAGIQREIVVRLGVDGRADFSGFAL